MRRRAFVSGALGLIVAPLAAQEYKAQPAKPARIGVLSVGFPPEAEAFREGLRDLGHVEGRTYVIEARDAASTSYAQLLELASDLARSQVDIMFAIGRAAAAAKTAAPGVPVVFLSTDPISEGLVASFNRPGGNRTGIAIPWEDLASKWVELLRDVWPRVQRVAVLFITEAPGSLAQLDAFRAAAAVKKVEVLAVAVRSASDLEPAFATAARQRAGAIAQVASPLFDSERPRMVALAARYRLPTIYYARAWVEAGGLMSYGPDLRLIFRRAAVYVDRILKGANPADLPVERPTKFDLVINLKTAKALGLTFPQSVLVRADEVVQ